MKQYIVDAFTDTVFKGNPAAVCILDAWIPEGIMMKIAMENRFRNGFCRTGRRRIPSALVYARRGNRPLRSCHPCCGLCHIPFLSEGRGENLL